MIPALNPQVFRLALPLGRVIAGFLRVHEFPACEADRIAARRNRVARPGRPAAGRVLPLIRPAALAVLLG